MILRDKGKITKTLILLELLRGKKKLKEIATDIDITVQGVSEYIRNMEREEYVKGAKVTIQGLKFLSNSLDEMGDFLENANKILKKLQVVEAIAGEEIEEGDAVGLFMEKGYIHAYHRTSSSIGTAMNTAHANEEIGVTNLRGVLNIDYGSIKVCALPSIEEGGTKNIRGKIKNILKNNKWEKIGVCGAVAYIALKDIVSIDFEFSAANAAIDAHYRGISSILFVSHTMLPHTLRTLEERGVSYILEKI